LPRYGCDIALAALSNKSLTRRNRHNIIFPRVKLIAVNFENIKTYRNRHQDTLVVSEAELDGRRLLHDVDASCLVAYPIGDNGLVLCGLLAGTVHLERDA